MRRNTYYARETHHCVPYCMTLRNFTPIIVTSPGLVWVSQGTQIASEWQDQFVLLATTEIQDRNRTISHPPIRFRLRRMRDTGMHAEI